MSDEAATAEARTYDAAISKLGDQLAELTLKQAVELKDYMKDTYGIEPAAGGAVMVAGPAGGGDDGSVPTNSSHLAKTRGSIILYAVRRGGESLTSTTAHVYICIALGRYNSMSFL